MSTGRDTSPHTGCRPSSWGQEKGWDLLTRWKLCVKKNSNDRGWGRGNLESLAQVGTPPKN